MDGIPIPAQCFLHRCQFLKIADGKKVWRNDGGDQFYTLDSMHGEIEVFNRRGRHLGVMNPAGELIKAPVRGRKLNV